MADTLLTDDGNTQIWQRPDGSQYALATPGGPDAVRAALVAKANAALTANATFLALGAPTNAQTLAQVQLLTRECNALIRLQLALLDTTAGT